VAFAALDGLLSWLGEKEGSHVGIFDATNSTKARRRAVLDHCAAVPGVRVAFLESICTDVDVLRRNYAMKLQNADYTGWDEDAAKKDFLNRTEKYEQEYETVEDDEGEGKVSFIKVLNCGEKTVQRRCQGFLLSKVAGHLLNMHIEHRVVYLTRHGQSYDNAKGKLGGDSELTKLGMTYATRLWEYMRKQLGWPVLSVCNEDEGADGCGEAWVSESCPRGEGWLLLTSQLCRTRMTARPILEDSHFVTQSGMRRTHTALLNEISAGVFDGYTAEDIRREAPDEHSARAKDKLRYRYPKGESYLDVAQRVKAVAMEIEREKRPTLVIAHQAVLRTMLAFFQGVSLEDMPRLEIPLHTVLRLTTGPHGCTVEKVPLMDPVPHAPNAQIAPCISSKLTGVGVDPPVQGCRADMADAKVLGA
jgi:broad specificity phosphatase PhoE